MNTRQYLGQINHLNNKINAKLAEIFKYRTMAQSISVAVNPDKVQTSGSQDKMADAVAKIVDLQTECNILVDNLIDKRNTIVKQIESMNDETEINILYLKYVGGKSFSDISESINYSTRQAIRIHNKAIKNFEEKYGKLY